MRSKTEDVSRLSKKMLVKPWEVMQISKVVDISQLPDSSCHHRHFEKNMFIIAADRLFVQLSKTVSFTEFSADRDEAMMYAST